MGTSGRSDNRPLNVRLHPMGKREVVHAEAERVGVTTASVVNQLIDFWLGVPGSTLPPGPWAEAQDQVHATAATG